MPLSLPVPGRMSLGGIPLPLAPQSSDEHVARQVVYVQTQAGAVRNDFGMGARDIAIAGFTGSGGLPTLLALKGLEGRRGRPGNVVSWIYPAKYGRRSMRVYVDDCTWSEHAGAEALLYYYTIKMHEAAPPGSTTPIVRAGR